MPAQQTVANIPLAPKDQQTDSPLHRWGAPLALGGRWVKKIVYSYVVRDVPASI